ncbi:MAG: NACHT domain-containing protein [Pseudanabaena sp. ELA607]
MDKQQFLAKFEELQKPVNDKLLTFVNLLIRDGKTKKEIAKAIRKRQDVCNPEDTTIVSHRLKEVCNHFGIKFGRGNSHQDNLVYLFRQHMPDFVHPDISPDGVDSETLSRPHPPTNSQNILTPNRTQEVTTLGSDRNSHGNNIVQNVRDKVRDWIELRCEDIRFADGQHRNVKDFHVEISCDSNSKRRMPLIDCLKSHYEQSKTIIKPIALLGKAGAGKTNSLKFLAMHCITGELFPDLVPFYFKLRTEDWQSTEKSKIFDVIVNSWNPLGVSPEEIEYILNKGNLLILLDGLDEVSMDYRQKVEKYIDEFILTKYPRNKAVITCRSASAKRDDSRYLYINIVDLDDVAIESFIKQYYQEYKDKHYTDRTSNELISAIQDKNKSQIKALAQTPINLTLICKTFFKNGKLADKRYQLYEYAFDVLVHEWNKNKNFTSKSNNSFNDFVLYLARQTFKEKKDFLEYELQRYLNEFLGINSLQGLSDEENCTRELLHDQITNRSGLLTIDHDEYYFGHLTWHEYFVARDIANRVENGTEDLQKLFMNLGDRQWREIFLFTVEMLSEPNSFLQQMEDTITAIIVGYPYLQEILLSLLKKSQTIEGKTKYGEATIRAITIEDILNDYTDTNCSNPNSIGNELLIDNQLEGILSITAKKNLEIEKETRDGLYIMLDRLVECQLDIDLPRAMDYSKSNNDRLQLHENAPRLPHNRSYIIKAIELAEYLGYHELENSLKNLEQHIPQSFGIDGDQWDGSEACHLWAEDLRKVMIEHRQIGHDWQNPKNGMTSEARQALKNYYNANTILAECLNLTDPPNASQEMKAKRRANLLLPISEIERRKSLQINHKSGTN